MFSSLTQSANKSLKIIIVGNGKVGHALTEQLSKEGNNITVIEKDPSVIADLDSQFDVITIKGSGASYSTLKEAGVEDADLVIAVTGYDDIEMASCSVPALTTVHVDPYRLGSEAMDLLCRYMDDPEYPSTRICLDNELVIRESS